jgi:hypothetical protein
VPRVVVSTGAIIRFDSIAQDEAGLSENFSCYCDGNLNHQAELLTTHSTWPALFTQSEEVKTRLRRCPELGYHQHTRARDPDL